MLNYLCYFSSPFFGNTMSLKNIPYLVRFYWKPFIPNVVNQHI